MQFRLRLLSRRGTEIPVNYQYPLSAVIYRVIERADQEYALFLHDTGYGQPRAFKTFKLFSFSDIKVPFRISGDRLQLLDQEAECIVSFHLPRAAENFIKGLFIDQRIEIADKRSKAVFTIAQVEALPMSFTEEKIQEVILQPQSPVVCGIKNERDHYNFLSPEHPDFIRMLLHNWKEKYIALHGREQTHIVFVDVTMEVIFFRNPPKSRLGKL
jgi:CRISPR-associated endoribonuclease Cas6